MHSGKIFYILFRRINETFITVDDIYNQDTPDLLVQLAQKRVPGGIKLPKSPNFVTGIIVTDNFKKNKSYEKYKFKIWNVEKQTKLYAPW